MPRPNIKKVFFIFVMLVSVFLLTSCGEYDRFCDELDMLSIDLTLPEPRSGAKSTDDAKKDIYEQQSALSEAYWKAYKITETGDYPQRYIGIEKDKIISALSNARSRINYDSEVYFAANLKVILQDAQDVPNINAYMTKQIEETREFYRDFIKLRDYTEDDYKEVTAILVKYYESDNEFAKYTLEEKEQFVIECATLQIEENSKVTEGHSASLQKNNEIIIAVNELFGGVKRNTDHASRITKANKVLVSYVNDLAKYKQEQLKELDMR